MVRCGGAGMYKKEGSRALLFTYIIV